MILLLLFIATISALVWHGLVKIFWIAVLGSTVTATLLVWFISSSHIGVPFLDFRDWNIDFIQNISIVGAVSFGISLILGGIWRKMRGVARIRK